MPRRNSHLTGSVAIDRLRTLPLFSACTKQELSKLAACLTEHAAMPGEVLAEQGTPGYAFFIIVEGSAGVWIADRQLATLGPGDFFGEIAILDNKPRTATVVAETEVRMVVSSVPEFATIVATSPNFTRKLLSGVSQRLRDTLRSDGRSDGQPAGSEQQCLSDSR